MSEIQSSNDGQCTASRCEVEDCPRRAVYLVSATWSIADFADYELCGPHAGNMVAILSTERVDGRLPIIVRAAGPFPGAADGGPDDLDQPDSHIVDCDCRDPACLSFQACGA